MTENGFNLTVHRANCCGNDKNCLYPHSVEVTTDAEFREAVKYDHVYFDFHNNYRSIKNFRGTSVAGRTVTTIIPITRGIGLPRNGGLRHFRMSTTYSIQAATT